MTCGAGAFSRQADGQLPSLGIGLVLSRRAITNPGAPAGRPGSRNPTAELEMPCIESPLVDALPTRLARASHQKLGHLPGTPPDPSGESVVQMIVFGPQPAFTNVRHCVSSPTMAPIRLLVAPAKHGQADQEVSRGHSREEGGLVYLGTLGGQVGEVCDVSHVEMRCRQSSRWRATVPVRLIRSTLAQEGPCRVARRSTTPELKGLTWEAMGT